MLDTVVNGGGGTGKRARSEYIRIVGKTGTSRIAEGGGYSSTQATFCGYFLVENKPQYSCIVYIRRARNASASGGGSCAPVFKEIAEKVYALNTISDSGAFPVDENHPLTPKVKNGLLEPSRYALKKLDISHKDSVSGQWAAALQQGEDVIFKSRNVVANLVPNVTGMGARDAVYALESAGLRVQLIGKGGVVSQSIASGERVNKGQTITIELK
jgi:cell division protein FtsI (penicillin-binding protein 3)